MIKLFLFFPYLLMSLHAQQDDCATIADYQRELTQAIFSGSRDLFLDVLSEMPRQNFTDQHAFLMAYHMPDVLTDFVGHRYLVSVESTCMLHRNAPQFQKFWSGSALPTKIGTGIFIPSFHPGLLPNYLACNPDVKNIETALVTMRHFKVLDKETIAEMLGILSLKEEERVVTSILDDADGRREFWPFNAAILAATGGRTNFSRALINSCFRR